MDKDTALTAFLQRCFDQRVPVYLVCARAGVSRSTPSRWKKAPETIRPSTLKKLEDALDWFASVPATCGSCDRAATDPETWNCTMSFCGMRPKRAA